MEVVVVETVAKWLQVAVRWWGCLGELTVMMTFDVGGDGEQSEMHQRAGPGEGEAAVLKDGDEIRDWRLLDQEAAAIWLAGGIAVGAQIKPRS